MSSPPDRADRVAVTLFAIFADATHGWLQGEPPHARGALAAAAAHLRDEFAAIERAARSERDLPDD
jgi:hypothetical protein